MEEAKEMYAVSEVGAGLAADQFGDVSTSTGQLGDYGGFGKPLQLANALFKTRSPIRLGYKVGRVADGLAIERRCPARPVSGGVWSISLDEGL